jgi:hypothetical protein
MCTLYYCWHKQHRDASPDPMQRANLGDIHGTIIRMLPTASKLDVIIYMGVWYSASHHVAPYKYDIPYTKTTNVARATCILFLKNLKISF